MIVYRARPTDEDGEGVYGMAEYRPDERVLAILRANEEINHLQDVDSILDRILLEARRLARAEAGSIFLVEGGRLRFSYVHNDRLFSGDEAVRDLYVDVTLPVDERSIVGYVALTGCTLAIDDAYVPDPARPFRFNPSYDEKSGYRTRSILTIPLKSHHDRLVGVMQLINALDPAGAAVPFGPEAGHYLPLFAASATLAIERGQMNRELILRMMRMAELRDPLETGAHVQRVGAYSAEIYTRFARRRGLPAHQIKHERDTLRLAAMLHDVGKVGISDFILKKPGRLTPEERDVMQWHTVYGARLFTNTASELDRVSLEIALNHHEKWAGGGYPGRVGDLNGAKVAMGEPKSGEEIPVPARVVALADVYDALVSRRCYKDPMPEAEVLEILRRDAGSHFDPEMVDAFFDILPVIRMIGERYASGVPSAG